MVNDPHATSEELKKLLLANGANQNALDEPGFNAMDYALMGEKPENAAFLKSLGLKQGSSAKPS